MLQYWSVSPSYSTITQVPLSVFIKLILIHQERKGMLAIPPIKAALVQHIHNAVYLGGHCWRKMLHVRLDKLLKTADGLIQTA